METEEKRGRAREYSFRAKQTSNDEWVYGSLCETAIGDGYYMYKAFVNKKYSIKQDTIGQYIRFKDKNKNWIYEGDIVRWICYKGEINEITRIGKVLWDEEMCRFSLAEAEGSFYWNISTNRDCEYEVIGNIYDNPELLGGDKNVD